MRNIKPRKGFSEKRFNVSSEDEESSSSLSPKELKGCDDSTDISSMSYEKENLSDISNLSVRSSRDDDNRKSFTIFCIPLLIGLFVCAFAFYPDRGEPKHEFKTKKEEFEEKINNLREKYQNQDDKLWISFNSGITGIQTHSPQKPSVFLLLHRGNYRSSECLVREMAVSAMKFLGNSVEPIFIQGEDIKDNTDFRNDYGLFLKKYQSEIEKRKVMVIFNLQDIPPVTAQAFHHLCDEINPLVREAAYVFTLQVSGEDESPSKVADRVLTSLWNNTLSTDKLDPLMVRIADIVLFVQPESNVCP